MPKHTHKPGEYEPGEYKAAHPELLNSVHKRGYVAPRKPQRKCKVCYDVSDRREKPTCPGCERPYMREKRAGLEYVESLPRQSRLVVPA